MKLFGEVEILKIMFELVEKWQNAISSNFLKDIRIFSSKLYNLIEDLLQKRIKVEYDKKLKCFFLKEDIWVNVYRLMQTADKERSTMLNYGILFYFFEQPHVYGWYCRNT